jgi:HEAT repeat protein
MKMNIKHLMTIALCATLAVTAAVAQTPYDDGQKALRESRWNEAAEYFQQAEEAGEQADAAMYWRAHALYKANRRAEATRQIRGLERRFPDSRWVREAQALQIEYQGNTDGAPVDDELRLFALSQLLERDPDRALPLVLDTLNRTDSDKVRRDALFLLGMSDLPQANQAVADFARNSTDPNLQVQAIHILGAAGSDQSMALLRELYGSASDRKVRRAVIHAYIAAGEPEPLVELLRQESDPSLQRDMLHALGAMGASAELASIYAGLSDPASKRAAIEAFSITGDTAPLREVIASETDPALLRAAITGIAVAGDDDAPAVLKDIYANATDVTTRKAVVEALIILGDGEELALEIVRTEKDPGVRNDAIRALGVMDATDRLDELYASMDDRESRKTVLDAMMIAGNTDGLISLLQQETDPQLKQQLLQLLAVMDSDEANEYLFQMLEQDR